MSQLRIKYKHFHLEMVWGKPVYIETMPVDDSTREFWRQATEDMQSNVSKNNLERPHDKRIAARNLHEWSS